MGEGGAGIEGEGGAGSAGEGEGEGGAGSAGEGDGEGGAGSAGEGDGEGRAGSAGEGEDEGGAGSAGEGERGPFDDIAETLLQGAFDDDEEELSGEDGEGVGSDDEDAATAALARHLGLLLGSGQQLADFLAEEGEGSEEDVSDDDDVGGLAGEGGLPDFSLPQWQQPLYDGSRISLGRYAFALLREKRAGRIRDTVFDRLLGLLSDHVFPQSNLAPRSLYLLKKAVGVEAAGKYEFHVCIHGSFVFPQPCCRHDYHLHVGDFCDCAEPASRFKTDSKRRLLPHAVGRDEGDIYI
jgi:hypothetical protein